MQSLDYMKIWNIYIYSVTKLLSNKMPVRTRIKIDSSKDKSIEINFSAI